MYFTILSGYGFDPGWWLEDSRVVKVYESSCDNEPRQFSFYGKIYEPQTGNVTPNFYPRSNRGLFPVKGRTDGIFYEQFFLYSPIVLELCFGTS